MINMATIRTRTTSLIENKLRAVYLKWRLGHVEDDIQIHHMNERLARAEAESIRCELARMGELHL